MAVKATLETKSLHRAPVEPPCTSNGHSALGSWATTLTASGAPFSPNHR